MQTDNFSVRWSGQVLAPVTGTYTFTTTSDDGVRLYVNGQLLIDNWTDHGVIQNSATIALVADQRYDIRMDFYDHGQLATARLSWAYPGQTVQVVPQWVLYPAPAVNQPPTVDAGADKTITLPSGAALSGIARDDGLPGPALTTTWSKISGREDSAGGTVTFANPNAPVTTATFGADGIYVLRLTVSDGAVTVSDDVTITVNPAPPNSRAGGQRGPRRDHHAAVVGDADGHRDRRRTAGAAGTAVEELDESQRPGNRDLRELRRALSTSATFSAAGTYVLRLTVSDSVLSSSDDVTVTVNPAPANGLTARYYRDPGSGAHFATLVLTRVDPTVNFTWGTAAPAAGVTADNFSVRWTGRVQAPVSGTYRFTTVSDDGIRLWVNGVQVINNWTDHAATTNTSAAITLTAGVKYTITLEFYEKGGQRHGQAAMDVSGTVAAGHPAVPPVPVTEGNMRMNRRRLAIAAAVLTLPLRGRDASLGAGRRRRAGDHGEGARHIRRQAWRRGRPERRHVRRPIRGAERDAHGRRPHQGGPRRQHGPRARPGRRRARHVRRNASMRPATSCGWTSRRQRRTCSGRACSSMPRRAASTRETARRRGRWRVLCAAADVFRATVDTGDSRAHAQRHRERHRSRPAALTLTGAA